MSRKKDLKIEYIRAIAAIGVVAIHTIYSGILYSGDSTTYYVVLFFTMIKNMLYWAVPCFGMISGFLLLNPDKEISVKIIIRKYLARIIIILLLFGTAFSWIEIVFNSHTISITQIPEAVLMVLKHQTWEHLWYLYALITIYLMLPIWKYIARKSNDFTLVGVIIVLYILSVILNSRDISLHMFFMMGEAFRRQLISFERIGALAVFGGSSALILTTVYLHEVLTINLNIMLGYTSLFVAIQAYALFSLLYSSSYDRVKRKMKFVMLCISDYSFGIYIVHMFFVNLEYKVLKLQLMNSLASLFIFVIMITVNVCLSYIVTAVIKMMPGLKRLV